MTRKTLLIATLAVIAMMIVAAVAVGASTPADLQLPTHWGLDGRPDRFSDKWTALLTPVLLVGGVSLILYFLPALEPRRGGLERSQGLYLSAWAGMLLIGATIQLAVASAALGWRIAGSSFILAGVGALFVIIGNQLGKSRSMYLIGIRTPWTLASEEVWIKTHRLAGKLMVAGGLLMAIAAFVPLGADTIAAVTAVVLAIVVGVPLLYSFILWRRERHSGQSSG